MPSSGRRWPPDLDPAEAARVTLWGLTVWRPWSWCISHLNNDIENRDNPRPAVAVGKWLAIHAGKIYEQEGAEHLRIELEGEAVVPREDELQPMVIVAAARLVGSVRQSSSRWFVPGAVGWVLTDRVRLPEPVPCKGLPGLWPVRGDVLQAVRAQWRAAVHHARNGT